MSALALQYRYCTVVERWLETHGDAVDCSLGYTRAHTVVRQWREILDAVAAGAFDALADRVDWVAKRRLLEALAARRPDVSQARLAQIDLDYHDIANGGTYDALVSHGAMRTLLDDDAVQQAVLEPPTGTRAALRGRFVHAAQAAGAHYACDWTRLTLTAPVRRESVLLDPFDDSPTADFRSLMEALQ